MQTETISALQIFEQGLSKSDIKAMAANAVESVLEEGNPLKVAEGIAAMDAFIDAVKADKRLKDYVRDEVAKEGKVYATPSGAKIELCEVGSKYDYSQCNDPLLKDLEKELELIKNEVLDRQMFLKAIPAAGVEIRYVDEMITVYPPAKTSTSSYKVTLAR